MNPFIERFNRTLEEEFINCHKYDWAYNYVMDGYRVLTNQFWFDRV
jgi:hypothetical protein